MAKMSFWLCERRVVRKWFPAMCKRVSQFGWMLRRDEQQRGLDRWMINELHVVPVPQTGQSASPNARAVPHSLAWHPSRAIEAISQFGSFVWPPDGMAPRQLSRVFWNTLKRPGPVFEVNWVAVQHASESHAA
jgi:hypothetical protein